MSERAVREFVEATAADGDLRARWNAASDDLSALVELGGEHGYRFEEAELERFLSLVRVERTGEIPEDQLAGMVGGAWFSGIDSGSVDGLQFYEAWPATQWDMSGWTRTKLG